MEPVNHQNMNQHFFQFPISFSDFNIIEQLSMSAYCTVYKACYKKTGKIYALKAKKQGYFQNNQKDQKEKDYFREKEILYDITKKNCHHVVKLYTDFQDANCRYLVMKYCEGTKLSQLRGNNPQGYVDQKLIIHILTQLLETLKYLHDTFHIIHRDITPNNIILGTDNNVKILGFGMSAYLVNPNHQLVSNKSSKGSLQFAPPELIFFPPPLNYDYKVDIFSLGFTIYSLMNPSPDGKINLPQKTVMKNNDLHRSSNILMNTFYENWLNDFVQLLYENDQSKRPTAAMALDYLKRLQTDPKFNEKYNAINQPKKNKGLENNNNPFMNNPNISIPNVNNKVTNQKNPLIEEQPQRDMVFDNKILSSMKCLLFIIYKLDIINFIKSQLYTLFNNNQLPNQCGLYSFYQILDVLRQYESGQINKENYEQMIINFIKIIFNNNNSGISGTRPIILFYMMSSIFRSEFHRYFDKCYQNNIFDNIIKNNFKDFEIILPMNIQTIYSSIKEIILNFQHNYKGPFVDQFYFLIITLSKCPKCGNLFGISSLDITQFLQLNVPNQESDIQNLINEFFTPKLGTGNHYNCRNCGSEGKKLRQNHCLNLPNYLFFELEDKGKINFVKKIAVPLYNGQHYYYEYYASIYKYKNNETTSFCAVFKIGNNYYFYFNDNIQQVPEKYLFLERPSLALYKKVSA